MRKLLWLVGSVSAMALVACVGSGEDETKPEDGAKQEQSPGTEQVNDEGAVPAVKVDLARPANGTDKGSCGEIVSP